MNKNVTLHISTEMSLEQLANNLVDSHYADYGDLFEFVKTLDLLVADWRFTKKLMDHFGSDTMKKYYNEEVGEDE